MHRFDYAHQINTIVVRFENGKLQRRPFNNIAGTRYMAVNGNDQSSYRRNILIFIDDVIEPYRLL